MTIRPYWSLDHLKVLEALVKLQRLLHHSAQELASRLQAYLAENPNYAKVFSYTKQRFESATNLTAHNWAHSYRDIINAIVIGEAENADMKVVLPAITMHDIGFLYGATGKTHGAVGADNLALYLREAQIEYPTEIIEHIADCIRTHKGSMHNEVPKTLEAKVVADADLLEKFGPFGVYQSIRTFTEFDYPLEEILRRGPTLATLTLETKTGQEIAEPGRQLVIEFFQALEEASRPYGYMEPAPISFGSTGKPEAAH